MKKFLALIFVVPIVLTAQVRPNSKPSSAILINPSFAVQWADGDMAFRFGQSYSAGLGVGYKTIKNWTFGVQAQFMFGTNVRHGAQLLNPVLTDRGNIINATGNRATFSLDQRGAYGSFDVSKTIPDFIAANANSGLNITFGIGYLAHWVKINNIGDDSPQLLEPYVNGYDELSGGLMLKQSIGYQYLSTDRRINFRISFELLEAFTTNYREFSYSTGKEVNDKMLDFIYGVRLDWYLPIYTSGKSTETYYYD